ncbi:NAD-dependent epimerase/dehydratase family protein [Paractinoplanes atraurantiacus]|uniref:Dihydroflavonol-4-reductase n=1 Tax=Paractinoplanes atraurantiacus TaxID=1036182 RepID=A0A285K898_9ACTN|nr:NAD-dependent epimerase/dehydratase family protein [Actinoplanes atraurantiacus]SNY68834.1 dihydroflavonol-4-reductase [Actinoplanes atraurantiacus]
MTSELVLVTGGSGFVGSYVVRRALAAGYRVRTTVRSRPVEGVESVQADLMSDEGWDEAVAGATYVLHVASPFPASQPADENDLIVPAREGTLRVLRAAKASGVRRVVLTSSFAAVGYGHGDTDRVFTEDDWTDVNGPGVQPYVKSKTLAERAAWDFAAAGGPELTVLNPTGIFGPVLGPSWSSSVDLIAAILDGTMTRIPDVTITPVDVRDLADLHLLALTHPAAAGERYIACGPDEVTLPQVAALLGHGDRPAAPGDRPRHTTNAKAVATFGWKPRPAAEMFLDTARSLSAFRQQG